MEPKESHPRHEEGKVVEESKQNEALFGVDSKGNLNENEFEKDMEERMKGVEDFYKEEDNEEENEVEKPVDVGTKSRGVIEAMNDYLESIFSTEEEHDDEIEEDLNAMYSLLWKILSGTLGVIAVVIILTKYPQYLGTLHENQLWFSNIKEVEREISFRTEQGLYYSYYKQIIEAPTWREGFNQLIQDNRTEHGRTINIIHRFNILPEIIISAIYRWLSPQESPSIFYVSSVFGLHGVFVAVLYITAWYLSDSVLAGAIAVILFIVHRIDTTRVNYTVPLRESFAIPLLFLQLFLLCTFIKSYKWQRIKMMAIFLLTVTILLSWQFGPFILLCQLFCFVFLARLPLLSGAKVSMLVLVSGLSLVVSSIIQANPPLVISSPALSMVVPAFILSTMPSPNKSLRARIRITIAAAELSLMLLATVFINGSIKIFVNIDADSHVYQFLLAKLQMGNPRDFDSRLYMCTEAFDYIDSETVERLCDSGLLPVYAICVLVFMVSSVNCLYRKMPDVNVGGDNQYSEKFKENVFGSSVLNKGERTTFTPPYKDKGQELENLYHEMEKFIEASHETDSEIKTLLENVIKGEKQRDYESAPCDSSQIQFYIQGRPDLVFFLTLSLVWSILAVLILRLKVLWMPTVCVLTGVFISDMRVYNSLITSCGKLSSYLPRWFPGFCKIVIGISYVAFICQKYWGKISSELWPEELYEFWDPDTVELMEWIRAYTPPDAVFAGSMQLLAGVKLCTGRHITNHPHYEDSWLRHRTHKIYEIYGREAPEVVYNALKTAGATHIILEDSICLAPPNPKRPLCRLTDIIDLHNGHIPENGAQDIPDLHESQHGRFCDIIRHKIAKYSHFFSLVMNNKTFRVFRIAVT
ncbi:protein C-mannosyl-transferase DPY19L3-like [Panulirus ornatus]|uniref:protein C-mannosyl-transferase DPY19L3-like n=1 Tax=Panulirus ornatus TaxID=150431 RepID=UPI003A86F252